MKLPFFASFIIFGIWLTFTLIRVRRKDEHAGDDFWEREARANAARKQPLDNLAYVEIPYENLPFDLLTDHEEIAECHRLLHLFHEKKAVNLTGYTNTDLKLQYGAPNIQILTEYDQNYTLLVRTLQKWADLLVQAGEKDAVVPILEFAISTHTDISATYRMLASIYHDRKEPEKIEHLKTVANDLRSAMRPAILRVLGEFSVSGD